ncbi:MAG: rod-binding protein [Alphaproteobacteria bacterium]|nr:rod-binding protein [Alphaproteobacteria bacterium SS10]
MHQLNAARAAISEGGKGAAGAEGSQVINGRTYTAEELAGIDKVATQFEAMVLGQMLQPMFAGIKTDENFGGGFAEDMYRGLMVSEYGKMIAETGGLGIADAVKRELLSAQEVPTLPTR